MGPPHARLLRPSTARHLRDGEAVFAFLDDVYIVALPEWVRALYDALSAALWERARIHLHEGKTRIWNAAGEEAIEPVWIGDWSLPTVNHGLTGFVCLLTYVW